MTGASSSRRSEAASAFDALYQQHAAVVWRWARRLGGPGTDVEDVVQEVFLLACRGLPAFRGESDARTWLYRITVRFIGRQRRRRRLTQLWPRSEPTSQDVTLGAEAQVQSHEAEILLYRALDRLDVKQRALLVAFELQELSGAEIAAALGLKLSTFWVKLHRARARLRRELEKLHAD